MISVSTLRCDLLHNLVVHATTFLQVYLISGLFFFHCPASKQTNKLEWQHDNLGEGTSDQFTVSLHNSHDFIGLTVFVTLPYLSCKKVTNCYWFISFQSKNRCALNLRWSWSASVDTLLPALPSLVQISCLSNVSGFRKNHLCHKLTKEYSTCEAQFSADFPG